MKNPNQWYCGAEGQQFGPFTWEQMRGMAVEGRLVADSPVRRDVDQQWFQASQIPGLLPKAHATSGSAIGKAAAGSAVAKAKPALKKAVAMAPAAGAKASDSTIIAPRDMPTVKSMPRVKPASATPAGAIPKGQAVAPPAPSPEVNAFAFVTQPAASPGHAAAALPKNSSSIRLVVALGGVAVLVALVGGGLLAWKFTRPSADQVAAEAADQETSLETVVSEDEGNPLAAIAPPSGTTATAAVGTAAATESPAKSSAAAEAKVLGSLPSWTDVNSIRSIALNKVKLRVDSAWFAADEQGTRADPMPTGEMAAAAKYVFVKLELENTAPVPRAYESWNATAGTSVVLADQANQVLPLLPVSQTPGAARLTKLSIQPGQTVYDVLVFAAPKGNVEKLKLALEKAILAEGAKVRAPTHFALEIPLETLLTKAGNQEADVAAAIDPAIVARQAAEGEQAPAIIAAPATPPADQPAAAAGADKPAAVAEGKPEMKSGDKPPSIEELNRQIEELDKKEGKLENTKFDDKGKEPAKKPGKPKE